MIVILLTCHMSLNRWSISQISFHLSISTHLQKPKLSPSFLPGELVINQTTILFLTFKNYYYAMEALNAAALVLKPISVLKPEPKKHSSFPSIPHLKPQFNGTSLVLISSVFNSAFAKALTYEEALNQSTTASDSSFAAPDLDVIDGIVNFGVENPLVVAGGAALLAVPAILSQVFGKSSNKKAWGVETAKIAYQKLGDDGDAQLLDIRAASDIRAVGSPNIKDLKKKPVTVAYNGDDKQGFLKKLSLRFKDPENTTLFILDKFDGSSELVAELVTVNGFKAAYAIKDGAEGPRGWMNSSLPWILPRKSFSFDLSTLNDAVDGILGEGNEAVTLLFGIAAAAGLSLFAFTEVRIFRKKK
ncbi:rhodanese-like domain-containing protein 4, chloroplastic [Helianthus annuus]|uniref:rhodanese-like domain-containing protein 4, chloroplastic n=1 Tax=Helianthus annuus TaxID=4232 RepID=UPI000B909987|nr:rhodanese-like domain-containing protein 4, chloroplastic [Helianthus annuus]